MVTWDECAHILANSVSRPGSLGSVSALAFDPYSELLWAGTAAGQVCSHYSPTLARYTSYPATGSVFNPHPVRDLLIDDRHVFSLGEHVLHAAHRKGLASWSLSTTTQARHLQLASICTSPASASGSELIAGGSSNGIGVPSKDDVVLIINKNSNTITKTAPAEAGLVKLRKSARLLCAGTANGYIQLRDPRSLKVEHRLAAHAGGLLDMAVEGNLIYSVGWTVRLGHPVPDAFVKVHDIRANRALVPLSFAAQGGPALLAIHPKQNTTVFVTGSQGGFQVVDVNTPGEGLFFQTSTTSFVTSMALSPSADFIAFGEADGSVRMWTSVTQEEAEMGSAIPDPDKKFCVYETAEPEGPDVPISLNPRKEVWRRDTPLSALGLPYYDTPLLSAFDKWSYYATPASPLFNPPTKPDSQILSSLRQTDFVGYASLPRHLRGKRNAVSVAASDLDPDTNGFERAKRALPAFLGNADSDQRRQAPNTVNTSKAAALLVEQRKKTGMPLFRSEREKAELAKRLAKASAGRGEEDDEEDEDPLDELMADASLMSPTSPNASGTLSGGAGPGGSGSGGSRGPPAYYGVKTIQYSKFGVEDFDFGFYNNTPYSGLETHIPQSYANSYLQLLFSLQPLRQLSKAHIAQPCPEESCLLCEAGFLFRMLEDTHGANCQATNFLRVFTMNRRAKECGVLDEADEKGTGGMEGGYQQQSLSSSSSHGAGGGGGATGGTSSDAGAYANMVQRLNRFLIDELSRNYEQLTRTVESHQGGGGVVSSGGAATGSIPMIASNKRTISGSDVTTTSTGAHEAATAAGTASALRYGGSIHNPSNQSRNLVSDLFEVDAITRTTCGSCGNVTERNSTSRVTDLVYPRKALSNETAPLTDLASILKASLVRETLSKSLCKVCHTNHAPMKSRRILPPTARLPHSLAINAAVHTPEHQAYWLAGTEADSIGGSLGKKQQQSQQQQQGSAGASASSSSATPEKRKTRVLSYVPPKLAISVVNEDVRARGIWNDDDLAAMPDAAVYTCRAMIVQIQSGKEASHLCAIVKVPEAETAIAEAATAAAAASNAGLGADEPAPSPKPLSATIGSSTTGTRKRTQQNKKGAWYLFNDFLVKNISEAEALSFPHAWKVPAVLLFERVDEPYDLSSLNMVPDPSILFEDLSISRRRDPEMIRHRILKPEELPTPGTLVSIDAEFVALNQEELEVRSDGTRSVIRPVQRSLARVSVLRGEGPEADVPFIDDHIHTKVKVVDYLTQFSGIVHGDLDPETSRHTLVPLKVVYKKLRLLVDLGCIFVGHGLSSDFRIINIHVPPSQIIDTVELYRSNTHPRRLALRFLSWFLLKQDIQSGIAVGTEGAVIAGHDSIEDAMAAMRLYRMYESFKIDGRLDDVMEDLYEEGRRVNWKPPSTSGNNASLNSAAATPARYDSPALQSSTPLR
ncbi:poly(A)-specific ribonuclease [Tilletia horrida]|uniref:PAN2-PAN3 deadenylation complex catalytic subunit PAN2 n=1 Tax=Tilletia horrida TaxID=155126 RepID=A0AAN6GSS1_9BASI|nr:poly(A)-specific ribonuclease [Tilletia horrida]